MRVARLVCMWVATSCLAACLGPRVEDDPGYSHRLWSEGTKPMRLEDDERMSLSIADADGLPDSVMPRSTGFLAGETVHFWDFGEASTSAAPAWVFLRKGKDKDGPGEPFGHPALVDTAPGDDGYGPLRLIYAVYVTKAYRGEVIPSFAALEDAIELGLVEEPESTGEVVAWPIVRAGAELEVGDEELEAPDAVLYRDYLLPCFKLEAYGQVLGMPMLSRGRVKAAGGYMLRRHLESEAVSGGELATNLVFTSPLDSMSYTGMVELTEVTVPKDYVFGDVADEAQLFPIGENEEPLVSDMVLETVSAGDYFMPLVP